MTVAVLRSRRAVLLGLAALLVYTPGFWWGAPHATAADRTNAWGVDDEPPLGPLAQAHDIIAPKKEMNPNLGYPMLHPFMVLGAFAPYVAYLKVSGGLQSPRVAYPHGFTHPADALRNLTWIAHFLSVLLGVGIVLCAYGIGRELWGESAGAIGAVFAMLVYPMFYYARNSNVDVPVLFFTTAGLWAFSVILMRGLTTRRGIWLGVFVGCAVATKEPAFASFLFVPLVLPFMRNPGANERLGSSATFWRSALVATGVALGTYVLASGMVVDFARWQAHLNFIRERTQLARSGGVIFTTYYPFTLQGHGQLAWRITSLLADALSWPGLALGIAGICVALRRAPRTALLACSALVYLLILFFSARVIQLRYVMPISFLLALYAGYAAVSAWRSARLATRWGGVALAGSAAAILLLWATDLTYGMIRDSRYAAAAWIASNARPGDALEYFGSEHKHPPMPPWLASRQAIPFRGSTIRSDTGEVAIRSVVEGWRERRPRFVALVPDYTSVAGPFAASCPPAIYRGLEDGSLGYRRAAFFQTPALLGWARRPALDHPVVNPPIRLYERVGEPAS